MKNCSWIGAVVLGLAFGAAVAAPKKHAPAPQPVVLTGTVSRIVDGDTLWLKTEGDSAPVVVRIEGIDAPERCQAGGSEATAALNALALGRSVTVRVVAHDDYGRTVGKGEIPYASAAEELAMDVGAVRVAVHRLRKRYRELLRNEVAETLSDPAMVDEELAVLLGAFR